MNNNNNNNELFGELMSAPNIPQPVLHIQTISISELNKSINNLISDNNMLYTKLMDLEKEIKALKDLISTIKYTQPIYFTQPQGQMSQLCQNQYRF